MPFIIVSNFRSGSQVFSDIICNHPECICEGELLNPKNRDKVVNNMKQMITRDKEVCTDCFLGEPCPKYKKYGQCVWGCLVKYPQLDGCKWLKENLDKFKVIHLLRKNILNVAISQYRWSKRISRVRVTKLVQNYSVSKITIPLNEIIKLGKEIKRANTEYYNKLNECKNLRVYWYEDFADKEVIERLPKEVNSDVFDFLGVDTSVIPETNLIRSNPYDIKDHVENHKEITLAFEKEGLV